MWSAVREDKTGPAHLVDDLKNGARVGGNKVSTGEDFLFMDLLSKRDEVAKPCRLLLDKKKDGAAPVITVQGNTQSSFKRELGFQCRPSRTSNRLPPHDREVKGGGTLAETSGAQVQMLVLSTYGWGE